MTPSVFMLLRAPAAWLFWIAAALIVYTYFGYVLLVALAARLARSPLAVTAAPAAWQLPFVTLVVAAYNEEAVIQAKLANCAALDYPAGRLELLFGSDGSTDSTETLIRAAAPANLRLLAYPVRRGKAVVTNDLIQQARGEILVFTDANTFLEPESVRRLAQHFQDPGVGGVCGRLVLSRALESRGAGLGDEVAYWNYESTLKRLEGKLGLTMAANGAIYAIRERLFRPLPTRRLIADDLLIPAAVISQGYAMTFEPHAVAHERTATSTRAELARKIRIAEMAYNSIPFIWPLLLPQRGRVAWMLWSHKLIRWAVPFLLLAMLGSALVLWPISFYRIVLLLQAGVYAAALIGYWLEERRRLPVWLSLPYYFAGANLALLLGFWRSLAHPSGGTWERTGR